ncbi:hypothetical protein [Sporomusa acidovorans]|uniref:Chromosome partition protein Smc n=1 Tax=Sporomusa acidovorans (strain ATCC 49682 / DSM 3132 / Mol) TaxID=1123286 RepID=A0ABZ3J500_SPOA4|nr:hypothetical protein [Sporomusa acidovorans]OZC23139.1 hypothetical protein SPACI_09710 [Sporomusa acidovorans DSM 3132]SDF06515.1 hypothetical protein SAMN04488499_103175 [Sporomusa acidovorans]
MEELLKQVLAKLDSMESDIKELKVGQQELKATTTRIEEKHGNMLGALVDAREAQQDVNDMILEKLNAISMKVDTQDLLIRKHDRELDRLRKAINI